MEEKKREIYTTEKYAYQIDSIAKYVTKQQILIPRTTMYIQKKKQNDFLIFAGMRMDYISTFIQLVLPDSLKNTSWYFSIIHF